MRTWSLQDAKARFSELVNTAKEDGPQIVTRRGEDTVIVMDIEEYRKLTRGKPRESLVEFLRNSPLAGLPSELFERDRDTGRDIEL